MFGCFFGHDWIDISSVIIKADWSISSLDTAYHCLGDKKYSDRICNRCDKVEFNKTDILEKREAVFKERQASIDRYNNKKAKAKVRFDKFKKMRDIANDY